MRILHPDESGVTPTWNFFKHLVDHRGQLLATFPTGSNANDLVEAVEKAVTNAQKEEL